ncbi:MAG: hypothetical protein O2944_09620 [Proteobacteria bacterium]|nr:hypothetical protein [Pseudomonadota bacterium]
MIDLDFTPETEAPAAAPDIVPVFLGLFLLVLAFFIMLVSISTFEPVKSDAVKDSLSSAFTALLPVTSDPTSFNAKDGDVIAGEAFQEQVTGIFSTAVQIERIEVIQPGRLMRITLPVGALYRDNDSALRSDQVQLFDRVVAALSNRPTGLRKDMEFVIGSAGTSDGSLPVGETLEFRRAGGFARMLAERGAPPDSVSVGVRRGNPGKITIWFWVRPLNDGRQQFEPAPSRALAGGGG